MSEEVKEESENTIEKVQEVENKTTEPINNNGKGLSIASLVLGIASILFCSNSFIAITCGVLAIIFGLKEKEEETKGMAKAGFILGLIGVGILLFRIMFVGAIVGLGTATILSVL